MSLKSEKFFSVKATTVALCITEIIGVFFFVVMPSVLILNISPSESGPIMSTISCQICVFNWHGVTGRPCSCHDENLHVNTCQTNKRTAQHEDQPSPQLDGWSL